MLLRKMTMRCSTLPTSIWKFSKGPNDYPICLAPLLQMCYTHSLLHRCSSNSTITSAKKTRRKGRKKTSSEKTIDLKDNFPFENLPHFHNGKDESVHLDGVAVSKNGKALFFPLARQESPNILKCIPKSDSTSASVSKILKETMPVERMIILKRWENKMIKELGLEGFQSYRQDMLRTGHDFHQYVHDYLNSGKLPDIPDGLRGYWTSIKHVFPDVTNIKVFEASIQHPYLNYHGIVDCVALWRNHLCVIDWKTSRKKKRTLNQTYDYPLQTAAYAGAINFSEETQNQITNLAIIIAYEDGDQADVHFLDTDLTKLYWTRWLERLQEYRESPSVST